MSDNRLNAYHIMWLFAMFDLPVKTKKEKTIAAKFKKCLEKDGFVMHQYSVYIRYCGSLEIVNVHIKRVQALMPPKGKVSLLTVTDKQFSNIKTYWGKIEEKKKRLPMQLELF